MRKLAAFVCLAFAFTFAAAQGTVAGVSVPRGAKVDIVFYTADNCTYCEQWKKSSKADAVEWAKENKVSFHEVGKPKIAMPYDAKYFSDSSRFAWEQINATGKRNFMIPRWVVYADQKPVADGSGTYDWGRVLRFAKDVVAARDGR